MELACPRWIGVAAREGTGVMRVSKLIAVTEAACSRTILVPLRDAACLLSWRPSGLPRWLMCASPCW